MEEGHGVQQHADALVRHEPTHHDQVGSRLVRVRPTNSFEIDAVRCDRNRCASAKAGAESLSRMRRGSDDVVRKTHGEVLNKPRYKSNRSEILTPVRVA